MLVAFLVVGAVLIGFSSPADAADPVVNPGSNFKATVSGGQLKVNTKLDLDVGTMSPAPRIDDITVDANGNLSAAATSFVFPQQVMQVDTPIGSKDIFINIRAKDPITGTIDPETGEVHINTSLTIQLTSNDNIVALGNNCYVGSPSSPIPFSATALPDDSKGIHYDQYSGETTVVDDTIAIPAASGCPTILGNNVNDIVNSELGLPSASGQNVVRFALRFNPAPHGPTWIDPNGPGHIDPVIVNDTKVQTKPGLEQRSWLESFAISNGTTAGRNGNTVRVSLLVKHDPGRSVTGLKIDDDWNGSEDSTAKPVKPVTTQQPVVQGGFNYSRVSFSYLAPQAGMNIACDPNIFAAVGDMSVTRDISVRAVLDDATESEASATKVRIVREDCNNHRDIPMIYDQVQNTPTPVGGFKPGDTINFGFKGDDTDGNTATYSNRFAGFNYRFRNLDTGQIAGAGAYCAPGNDNQDGVAQSVNSGNATAPARGRWVMEAELLSRPYPLGNGCIFESNPDDGGWGDGSRHWLWIGAIDVNSPQESGGDFSPSVTLNVPARPGVDGSLPVSVATSDSFDALAGGKTSWIEWDLDGDNLNGVDGFETARLGDSRTGMSPGQNQILLDTSAKSPGIYPVRVRVGDNGALGGADDIRRTTVSDTKSYMVNTPPTAQDLSVTTEYGKSVATPLVAGDTNADNSHDPLTWSLVNPPAHGYLAGEWPNRSYHPDGGFSGPDSFTYRVNDGFGGSATATVSITVQAKPADPVDPEPDPDNPKRDHLEAAFPEGRMNLNEAGGPSTSGIKVVDSAINDAPVTFKTEYWNSQTGEINAPASDFSFPSKSVQLSVTEPIPLDLDVKIEFGALGNITGNYNQTTGAMRLNLNAHALITITAGGGNIQVMTCDVTPIPLSFISNGADLVDPGETGKRPPKNWKAAAFSPPARDGAVTSLWNSLPASTPLSEPLKPTASCGGTLDAMIGGKGGFWLGGKVKVAGTTGPGKTPQPTASTAVFDGKRLHVRLKCGPQYRPSCNMTAAPVTGKDRKVKKVRKGRKTVKVIKGKPMAKPLRKKIKAGKWIKVTFLIKPKYRAKVRAMSKKKSKQLYVQQKIRSKKIGRKKFKGKKPRIVYHRYKVRSAG
ncbi:MAG: Ig-like domain-containing protein [Solirubrobacterales bacterium]|nr:Ig-like domain-containing protein [Solirubrobacterales bacterium]